MLIFATLALGGCASTPEGRLRREWWDVYWEAARGCVGSSTNIEIDNVESGGRVHLAVHHTTINLDMYRQCYWDGLAAEIARRRAGGLVVPEWVNDHPAVDTEVADD